MSTGVGLVAFAVVVVTGFVWFRRALAVRLPASRKSFVLAMTGGAILGAAALAGDPGWIAGSAATFALAAGALFGLLVAISGQKGGAGRFQVGSPVPDFSAPDQNGEPFQLSSLAGRPFLLKFFRGHW